MIKNKFEYNGFPKVIEYNPIYGSPITICEGIFANKNIKIVEKQKKSSKLKKFFIKWIVKFLVFTRIANVKN